ncbi:PAS domain-containing protein [Wenjunlia tyrosinilytica]|uniref:Diguanylate cyclase n=1 Tax=Wenjunlia tyrosinilytica TaxID=1544741 RepID=A0A917ZNA6_9ACTN|nr:PAS domain-containing protein [Wenjunlia tyrosinilytica]GGO86885.1 diguanylate cyclase [Wenjunlia tyrosinilytica]
MSAARQVPRQGTQDPQEPSGQDGTRHGPAAAGRGGDPDPQPEFSSSADPADTDLLTAILDGMDVALCAFDADGTVTHWNREAEKILGWTAEEAVGRQGFAGWAVREADADEVRDQLLSVMDRPRRRVHEFALLTKDGRRVLVRTQSAVVSDPDGEPAGVYCAFSEVHTQIELERSLALSEALFDDAPWGVIVIDADLRPAVVNGVAARSLHTGRESLLGRPIAELLRDGAEELESAVHHVLGEGTPQAPVELWISLREDETGARSCWRSTFLRLGSPLGEEPVPLGVAWLFQDVTETKQAEQESALLRFRGNQLRRASRTAAECDDPMEAVTVHLDFALAGFADHALIDVATRDGRLVRVAATPTDAAGPCVPSEPGGIPVGYDEGHPALQAVNRCGSVRTSVGRAPEGAEVEGERWAEARRWPKGTVHGLSTVLRSRGRTLGAVTFLRGPSRRHFDRADAAYAEEVAVRIAAALDLAQQL